MSEQRTILITGVTKGLGLALARGMIQAGHLVVGCGRNVKLIKHLQSEFGDPHHFTKIDVRQDTEVKQWAEDCEKWDCVPDLLLNNAGVINPNAPLWEVSDEAFTMVMDVNVRGVTNVIRHFFPLMKAAGRGIIVNFSSGWGRSTSPDVAPYCASKWAVEGLTKALAQELPADMATIALNPGIINTELLQSCFGSSASSFSAPGEWAELVIPFLLNLSVQNNGQSLTAPS